MLLKRRTDIILFQIVSWLIAFLIYAFMTIVVVYGVKNYLHIEIPVNFTEIIILDVSMGFFIGLLMGFVDIFHIKSFGLKRSFRRQFLFKTLSYIAVISIITISVALITYQFYYTSTNSEFMEILDGMLPVLFFSTFIYASFVSLFISFLSQASIKFGKGVLVSLMTGKYYQPEVENRIFMFLDLKNSTAHAENLGHVKYSELLQDCIYDLNSEAINSAAQIFQYVGDGIVLTWKLNSNEVKRDCLDFYFRFIDLINHKAEYYTENYGFIPQYKAGINSGKVTATEIGNLKREIAFHGDTINTAARVQDLCTELDEVLLISEYFENDMILSQKYSKVSIGNFQLKGRKKKIEIFSISKK